MLLIIKGKLTIENQLTGPATPRAPGWRASVALHRLRFLATIAVYENHFDHRGAIRRCVKIRASGRKFDKPSTAFQNKSSAPYLKFHGDHQ